MKNETVYPEWVQEHKTKGATVKKAGGSYYRTNYFALFPENMLPERKCIQIKI